MLYDHQKKIIDEDPKKCGLFLGTGGGKSRTALSLARGKTLIIMPKTQFLDNNWGRELKKLSPEHDIEIFQMSKETFKRDHEKLARFDTVIIDEAHTIFGVTPNIRWRNRQPIPKTSQLFEAAYDYINRTKPKRLYLCTATPARNPMSVWAALTLLGKEIDWERWRRSFYVRLPMPGREVWQPKKDVKTLENLAKIVQTIGYTGRLQDWFDVPDQVDRYVHCQLSKEEEQRIHELPLEFPDPLVLVGKTHQAEQGESKLEVIDDLLAEYPKVLVFARYLDQIKKIEEHFKGKLPVFVLTGQTKDRKKLFEDAEKSHQCLFIAQSQVSAGYELPSFRCVVYASLSYSFVDYTQSRGRVLRANALNKNLYVHLHSGKVDVAIIKCMQGHQDFEEKIYAQGSSVSNKV